VDLVVVGIARLVPNLVDQVVVVLHLTQEHLQGEQEILLLLLHLKEGTVDLHHQQTLVVVEEEQVQQVHLQLAL
jgi:hypothetical protein